MAKKAITRQKISRALKNFWRNKSRLRIGKKGGRAKAVALSIGAGAAIGLGGGLLLKRREAKELKELENMLGEIKKSSPQNAGQPPSLKDKFTPIVYDEKMSVEDAAKDLRGWGRARDESLAAIGRLNKKIKEAPDRATKRKLAQARKGMGAIYAEVSRKVADREIGLARKMNLSTKDLERNKRYNPKGGRKLRGFTMGDYCRANFNYRSRPLTFREQIGFVYRGEMF